MLRALGCSARELTASVRSGRLLRPRGGWVALPDADPRMIAAARAGAQRTEDIRHDAQLKLMGYHVIRVSYHQIVNDWPAVQAVIIRAVAQGLHRAA